MSPCAFSHTVTAVLRMAYVQIRRAYIMLKSDSSEGGPKWKFQVIWEAYEVSQLTMYNVRKKFIWFVWMKYPNNCYTTLETVYLLNRDN